MSKETGNETAAMQLIVQELYKRGHAAAIEYPGYIAVPVKLGVELNIGTVNGAWDYDIMVLDTVVPYGEQMVHVMDGLHIGTLNMATEDLVNEIVRIKRQVWKIVDVVQKIGKVE